MLKRRLRNDHGLRVCRSPFGVRALDCPVPCTNVCVVLTPRQSRLQPAARCLPSGVADRCRIGSRGEPVTASSDPTPAPPAASASSAAASSAAASSAAASSRARTRSRKVMGKGDQVGVAPVVAAAPGAPSPTAATTSSCRPTANHTATPTTRATVTSAAAPTTHASRRPPRLWTIAISPQ
ncbi:hypothetical protein ET495_03440 [Xylanimonas allomyrinae]|uniref:Uncharacterized protein n=1 Tax=Xylanimonas allomyrinae TaxID=2509459 RepID=A0A4P6EIP3_9MICO|nr:hypothetical protein ET495_03440 [Xylanimonas allomyrinae]